MTSDNNRIKHIADGIRSLYINEYQKQITHGDSLSDLEKEVAHLGVLITNEKTKRKGIIDHLSNCFFENSYDEFPISNDEDELDVISMGLNTYMEELNAKTISRDYFDKIFNSIPQDVFVFDYDGNIDLFNIINKQYFKKHKPSDRKIENYFNDEILNKIELFINNENENLDFEIILSNKKITLSLYYAHY